MSTAIVSDVTEKALEQEFEELFRKHYRMAYRTAYGVTGSSQDAEDIVQTVFLRLLRREFPPDLKRNPAAYLYRAAVNLSLNTLRDRKRHFAMNTGAPAITSDSVAEGHKRLYEAVSELSPGAADILILRYVHDYSDVEIAKLLGTTRGTIAVSLYRSRRRLKKLMGASSSGGKA